MRGVGGGFRSKFASEKPADSSRRGNLKFAPLSSLSKTRQQCTTQYALGLGNERPPCAFRAKVRRKAVKNLGNPAIVQPVYAAIGPYSFTCDTGSMIERRHLLTGELCMRALHTTEAPARTHAHARALCCSPSLAPLSCTSLACESGATRMQLEPQLLASQ